jgi:hypothetical protein
MQAILEQCKLVAAKERKDLHKDAFDKAVSSDLWRAPKL